VGAAPGTLAISADARPPTITSMQYNKEEFSDPRPAEVDALAGLIQDSKVTWIDVEGLGDEKTIRAIGSVFHLHPLAVEDIVHEHQRPKTENYDRHYLATTRFPRMGPNSRPETEQVTIILGPH